MPILAHEPDIFPENLLDEKSPPPEGTEWYAIHTLSRREKELMRRLRSQKISHYCPLAETRKRSPAGRIRTSYLPLFRSYVFVRGKAEDRYKTVATGCVANCIDVVDAGQLITDLRRIRLLNGEGTDIRSEPEPLIGRRAVVISGPMTGVQGTITETHSQHRLTVVVSFMQQGASVTIDEADVELLD
ncbi:MAG: transcription termination/antitermination NusG family protein [Planctomycetaceae bacterium]|jgi:transcriptional antiterminator RfaH